MSDNPFRSELDAAHRRIAQLEAEHTAQTKKLEDENARLRQRLIDQAPSRTRTGRTFGVLGIMILAFSLAIGIVFARTVSTSRRSTDSPQILPTVELDTSSAKQGDFDRELIAYSLDWVDIHSCVTAAGSATGHIKLIISPTGTISSALIDEGPLKGTDAGRCIEARFRDAHVPPFVGPTRAVGRSFHIP